MQKIDIKTSNYFEGMPYLLGFVLLVVAIILLLAVNIIASFLSLLAGIAILTTSYRLTIDLDKKLYSEYISLLGMRVSEDISNFDQIEYIFIKKKRVSQQLNSRAQSTTVNFFVYDAYLRFSENEKVHLITNKNKEKLRSRVVPIARQLKADLVDYSDEGHVSA